MCIIYPYKHTHVRPAQKNKATSYHLGLLKAKLAKLRRELITPQGGGGGGQHTHLQHRAYNNSQG